MSVFSASIDHTRSIFLLLDSGMSSVGIMLARCPDTANCGHGAASVCQSSSPRPRSRTFYYSGGPSPAVTEGQDPGDLGGWGDFARFESHRKWH